MLPLHLYEQKKSFNQNKTDVSIFNRVQHGLYHRWVQPGIFVLIITIFLLFVLIGIWTYLAWVLSLLRSIHSMKLLSNVTALNEALTAEVQRLKLTTTNINAQSHPSDGVMAQSSMNHHGLQLQLQQQQQQHHQQQQQQHMQQNGSATTKPESNQ